MRWTYYKFRQVLQSAMIITNCDSTRLNSWQRLSSSTMTTLTVAKSRIRCVHAHYTPSSAGRLLANQVSLVTRLQMSIKDTYRSRFTYISSAYIPVSCIYARNSLNVNDVTIRTFDFGKTPQIIHYTKMRFPERF